MTDEASVPAKRPQFGVRHHEGHLSIGAGDLYYREFGTGDNVLVGRHGGPGGSRDVLAPLAGLAGDEWMVYIYDQYGSGRSDAPAEADFDAFTARVFATASRRSAGSSARRRSTSTATPGAAGRRWRTRSSISNTSGRWSWRPRPPTRTPRPRRCGRWRSTAPRPPDCATGAPATGWMRSRSALVLNGELAAGIDDAEFVEHLGTSHLTQWEDRAAHLAVVRDFLASVV